MDEDTLHFYYLEEDPVNENAKSTKGYQIFIRKPAKMWCLWQKFKNLGQVFRKLCRNLLIDQKELIQFSKTFYFQIIHPNFSNHQKMQQNENSGKPICIPGIIANSSKKISKNVLF